MSELRQAIDDAGGVASVASACGISLRAIYKWLSSESLPRTEYTGETRYAELIAELADARGKHLDPIALRANASPKKTAA
ncbi:helix-turn-helix domain-containing protein [Pseudomonas knackmussii]|uniref:helix-turn-helix domain-containing protein n=1 Tax=Pseudomonas knackmussii TaxID=65741 RepID=UPI001363CA9E|nr:helix-turn-helix domain-containing protein [Pseudomonas knackmussii]